MSYWENVCESYIDTLFQASKVNRIAFQTQCAQNVRKNFDQYIIPYQMSDEVRATVTNIATTVKTPLTSEVTISPFPKDQLLDAFKLEEVKRVREFVSVSQKSQRAPKSAAVKRQFEETLPPASAQPQPVVEAKRSKAGMPVNFYQAVEPLFQEFWLMKFPKKVEYALFAKITMMNCREYELPAFAEHSSSLSVIKDKLTQRSYLSVDDFENDFNRLFSNVLRYYPENHEACQVALQLREKFLAKWPSVRQSFIW